MPRSRTSPKRVLKDIRIDEISAVDRPAQEGAVAVIMKRRTDADGEPVKKYNDVYDVLTSTVDGHQHGVRLSFDYDSKARFDMSYTGDNAGDDHNHPMVIDDGVITIGEANGHTHDVDTAALMTAVSSRILGKGAGGMSKENPESTGATSTDDVQKQIDKLTKRAERSDAIIALSPEHRSHFDELSEGAQTTFLTKSSDERSELIKTAKERASATDPVAYTTSAGLEIRKSAGTPVIELAKSHDALAKRAAAAEAENERNKLAKRVNEELGHLPGSVSERSALLKAVMSIDDETERTAALAALTASNADMAKAFDTVGTTGATPDADTPEGAFEALVQKHAADNKVSIAVATDAVSKTAKGSELYKRAFN